MRELFGDIIGIVWKVVSFCAKCFSTMRELFEDTRTIIWQVVSFCTTGFAELPWMKASDQQFPKSWATRLMVGPNAILGFVFGLISIGAIAGLGVLFAVASWINDRD